MTGLQYDGGLQPSAMSARGLGSQDGRDDWNSPLPSLVYTDESGERITVEFADGMTVATIGRNPGSVITTTNPSVSRDHSEIRLHGPYALVSDKGSSNGTFVNDDEVKKPVVLQGGDLIKCGDFEIKFLEQAEDEAAAAAKTPKERPPEKAAPSAPAARPRASSRDRGRRVQSSAANPAIKADLDKADAATPPAAVEDPAPDGELSRKVEELQALVSYYEAEGDPAELQAKIAEAETELTRQQAIAQTLEEQQEQLQLDLRQQDKLIGELENRLERRDMEIENHLEKQKELRAQLAHQSEQIGDLRGDINARDHEIEDLAYKHDEAQRSVDEGRKSADVQGHEIQDFKAQLSQKSRLVEELQKQLDIMTFDLKAANEELESVSETSTQGGAEVASLERKVRHLQEIVTDKEGIIDGLKSLTDDQAEEIGLMREDGTGLDERERTRWEGQVEELRSEVEELRSAGRGGATTDKLNELKRTNREMRHRIEELEAQARAEPTGPGGAGGGDGRQLKALKADLQELDEENELLRERIQKMRKGGGKEPEGDDSTALKRENRELRRRLRDLKEAPAGGSVNQGDSRTSALIEDMNAALSTWLSDFDSASFSAAELKRLVEMLDRVDLSGLESRDRRKLESIIRDVEPHETLGALEDTLNVCLERAKDMKAKLKDAKQRGGGS